MIRENFEISIVSNRKYRESRFIIIFQTEGKREKMEHSYGMLLDYIARIIKMEIRV